MQTEYKNRTRGIKMREVLNEIIEAIKTLNHRDFLDYLAIVAPLVLSFVAIFISVYTIRKQTKIDLFEKRYETIQIFSFLLEGSKTALSKEIQAKDLWKMGMYNYKSMNSLLNSDYEDNEVLNFYYNLVFQIMKIDCLFPKRKIKNINEFTEIFMNYISNLFCDNDTKEDEKQLKTFIDLFEKDKSLSKLDKYLKIW